MTARLLILLALAAAAAGCGGDERAAAPPGSTLRATLVDRDGDGALEPGPAEPLAERTDVGGGGRAGEVLVTLAQLTDIHVRDEESPARAPFLDRAGGAFGSTFRPHEALSPQVLAASVRAVNRLGPDATIVTGDLLDSAAAVELDQALAVLDGGTVEPDTGGAGYAGVQAAANPDALIYRPDLDAPRHPGLLAAAQRPFRAPGLTAPWYPALGNHDVLVAGETPPTARLDGFATGERLVAGLDPDRLRAEAERDDTAAAVDELLAAGAPGRALRVPADPRRRHLRPPELIGRLAARRRAPAALRAAASAPRAEATRPRGRRRSTTRSTSARPRARSCSTRRTAAAARAGSSPPLSSTGSEPRCEAPPAAPCSSSRTTRSTARWAGRPRSRPSTPTPGVVAVVSGNSHRNRIRPRRTTGGGYWQIGTSSLADHPQQGRALRLRRTAGGYALETWMLDHDGRGLAGTARELAFLDAQGGRPQGFAGRREDRNARLFVAG